MKKFREFGVAIIALIACISMTGCSNENAPLANEDEQEVYTVQLGWGGELDVTYEPLSRATTDDVYGIQVYSTPNKELEEGEKVTWTKYAYGLFDNTGDITINLLKGYKYKFISTMVVDGKNVLNTFISGDVYGFYQPFLTSGNKALLNNTFDYQSSLYLTSLGYGNSYMNNSSTIYNIPNTDRFYGELENYVPSKNNDKVKIKMKRTSFGAKFIAKGKLASKGILEVQMTGAPKMTLDLSQSNKQLFDTFTFSDVDGAWADNQYTETIDVTINWHYTATTGETITVPLGTHQVTYKRNATTVVNITIDNEGNMGQFGFEYEEGETGTMPETGENDKNIVDGEVVNTPVDTNK